MPELPEVETMVRGIAPHLTGSVIEKVELCRNRCKPIQLVPGIASVQTQLQGQTIEGVHRLGKRVVINTVSGLSLVIEPRMTGLVLIADAPDVEHLRFKIQFRGDTNYNAVWFWDRRGLGVVRLVSRQELETKLIGSALGKDALAMTLDDWKTHCKSSRREIKVLLLDQKTVAGIGNLYASEILHRAGINPLLTACTLTDRQLARLAHAAQSVLQLAVECEGSTLGDGTYRNALNQTGKFQNEHRVYMRSKQSCLTCRKGTILRIVQAQRSTFFCPVCQKFRKR